MKRQAGRHMRNLERWCFVKEHFWHTLMLSVPKKKKDQVRVLRIFKVRCSKHFYHSQRRWKVRSLLVTHGPEQRSQWGRPAWNDIHPRQYRLHTFDDCHQKKSGREEHGDYQLLRIKELKLCALQNEKKKEYVQTAVPGWSCIQNSESGLLRHSFHARIASYLKDKKKRHLCYIRNEKWINPYKAPFLNEIRLQVVHYASVIIIPPDLSNFSCEWVMPQNRVTGRWRWTIQSSWFTSWVSRNGDAGE